MSDLCPACGRLRVPIGSMYIGTDAICHCTSAILGGTVFIEPPQQKPYGWVCAKCGASYSPYVYRCEPCSQPQTYTTTTTGKL